MRVLRREVERVGRSVLFVATEDPARIDSHFEEEWAEARVISDPDGRLYRAFGLGRGTLWQFLRPAVWVAGLRALFGGNGIGRPSGDPLMMSGFYLVEPDGRITWEHESRHAGDVDVLGRLPAVTGTSA